MGKLETIIGREFSKKVIPIIKTAKKSIDVIVYDWRWYADQIGQSIQIFNQEIIKAAARGVQIRVICEIAQTNSILNANGIKAKKINYGHIVHAKLMLVDDEIIITGSHNYTQNAFENNLETSVIIESEETKKNFQEYFNKLWQ